MAVVSKPFTNGAYGFPRVKPRRIKPIALACIHITGNRNTAAMTDLHAAAMAERNYANRPRGFDTSTPDYGPTAHDYDARDGWTVRALDPLKYAAWSNGDVSAPNTANAGIQRVLAMRAKGYNANEAYWLESEEVGYGSLFAITTKQRESIAARIAAIAKIVSMAASRETIHGHWEINGINRRNCPAAYDTRETFLRDIVARVNRILDGAEMTQRAITTITPRQIRILAGQDIFDLDGITKVGDSATERIVTSPCGRGTADTTRRWREWYIDLDGSGTKPRRSVLSRVDDSNILPVEPPGDCSAEIATAITADRAKAKIVYG